MYWCTNLFQLPQPGHKVSCGPVRERVGQKVEHEHSAIGPSKLLADSESPTHSHNYLQACDAGGRSSSHQVRLSTSRRQHLTQFPRHSFYSGEDLITFRIRNSVSSLHFFTILSK